MTHRILKTIAWIVVLYALGIFHTNYILHHVMPL